jgi:hypothetical protein
MKRCLAALAALGLLATPALAVQSKLEQAIAKADEQLGKGKPEDAVKTLTKAANDAGADGQVALARLQERIGNLDAAGTAYEQAKGSDRPARAALCRRVNFTRAAGKATTRWPSRSKVGRRDARPRRWRGRRCAPRTRLGARHGRQGAAAGSGSAIAQIARGRRSSSWEER